MTHFGIWSLSLGDTARRFRYIANDKTSSCSRTRHFPYTLTLVTLGTFLRSFGIPIGIYAAVPTHLER